MAHIISLFPCLKINITLHNIFLIWFDAHKQNYTINCPPTKNKKMGRAVPLKWAEQSRIEKWAETSGPRSPGPKWFWAEESRNRMRRTCAIQQAMYLLKVMFRWIQLLAITGQRCNDDFMLSLWSIMPYFWSF